MAMAKHEHEYEHTNYQECTPIQLPYYHQHHHHRHTVSSLSSSNVDNGTTIQSSKECTTVCMESPSRKPISITQPAASTSSAMSSNGTYNHHHLSGSVVAEAIIGHDTRTPMFEMIPDQDPPSSTGNSNRISPRSEHEENTQQDDRYQDCNSRMDVIPERILLPTLDDLEQHESMLSLVFITRRGHGTRIEANDSEFNANF